MYDKGRNWTSVVLEVVPVSSGTRNAVTVKSTKNELDVSGIGNDDVEGMRQAQQEDDEEEDDDEDDNVVEIPIRVRLEWRQSDVEEGEEGKKKTTTTKVNEEGEVVDEAKRELAYWMVLGVGRVGS